MAERYAIGTGNWSDATKWDGGTTVPGSGDTVHGGGFTITLDQNVTCTALTTAAGGTAPAGGGFTMSTVRNVNANITAGTTDCLTITATSGTATITGTVNGSATTSGADGIVVLGAGCTVNVIGAVTGGTGSAHGIVISIGSTLNVTGNVTGGTGTTARGISNTSGAPTITVIGDAIAAAGQGVIFLSGTLTLNGNAIASTTTVGVYCTVFTPTFIHNGNQQCSSSGIPGVSHAGPYLIHATNATKHVYRGNNGGSAGAERSLTAIPQRRTRLRLR
jgi:hypothetical protein